MLSASLTLTLKTTDSDYSVSLPHHSALSSSLRRAITLTVHRERVPTALPTSTLPAWGVLLETSLQTSPREAKASHATYRTPVTTPVRCSGHTPRLQHRKA